MLVSTASTCAGSGPGIAPWLPLVPEQVGQSFRREIGCLDVIHDLE